MFCTKCGNEVAEKDTFCNQCGAKLTGDEAEALQESAAGQQASDAAETQQQEVSEDAVKKKGKRAMIAGFGMWCFLHIASIAILLIGMIGVLENASYFLNWEIPPMIYWLLGCGIVAGSIIKIFLRNREDLKISRAKGLLICGVLAVAAICIAIFLAPTGDGGGDSRGSGNGRGSDKYVRMVKTGTLEAYPQKTVGDAFDDYLKNPKWESGLSEDGVRLVNVSGKILYYDKEADVVVQFTIDDKAGTFSCNACELNGIPQNYLFVLGLLDVVYNDDPAPGVPSSGDWTGITESGNKIEIGETWSVNNEDGNMEVTLDSIEFRGGVFGDPIFGTVPDEGCIWLVATITVENVGTKKCSFSGIETLVYDGAYEYTDYGFVEGDSLSGIAPLTEPKTQSIAFMVPKSVTDSEKSLVFNIADWYGDVVISYAIRPGDGVSSGTSASGDDAEIISMYEGSWQDTYSQRAYMEIGYMGGGFFEIIINWSSGAAEWTQWELEGFYDDGGIHYCGNEVEYYGSYETGEIESEIVSFDEEGFLWIDSDGILYWNAYGEAVGEYCAFEKIAY